MTARQELTGDGPCGFCGRDPALGFASIYNSTDGEVWLCHPDDLSLPDCYWEWGRGKRPTATTGAPAAATSPRTGATGANGAGVGE